MNSKRIRIKTQVYLLIPLLLLILPDGWVISLIVAATIHETFHLLMIRLFHITVIKIEIGIFGAKIETEPMNRVTEAMIALAGPIGALSALLFSRQFPKLAICVLAQSVYNLLPIFPLDGGRALHCLLANVLKKEHLIIVERCMLFIICLGCIILSTVFCLEILPVLFVISLFIKSIKQINLENRADNRYNMGK